MAGMAVVWRILQIELDHAAFCRANRRGRVIPD